MTSQNLQVSSQKALKQCIEQIERLIEDRDAINGDVKDKLQEAKSAGFDPKIIKKVLAIRKKSKADYLEEEAVLTAYLQAVSWLNTPLGAQSETDGPRLVASQ